MSQPFPTERYYITTASGTRVYFDDPSSNDFRIEDIAVGLTHMSRWSGQTHIRWSVAQHSLVLYHLVPEVEALAALLHDAAEAYMGDWTRPLIRHIGAPLADLKLQMEQAIEKQFNFSMGPQLKFWDDQIIHLEASIIGAGGIDPRCQADINVSPQQQALARARIEYFLHKPDGYIYRTYLGHLRQYLK